MIRDETHGTNPEPIAIGRPATADTAGLAAATGIAGALAASACCLVPLILFSLGAGGVWIGRLAALSPYQPYFIALAAVSVGYGFWKVYLPIRKDCSRERACARPLPRRAVKAALWTATALIAVALTYPYALPYLL